VIVNVRSVVCVDLCVPCYYITELVTKCRILVLLYTLICVPHVCFVVRVTGIV